jgi:DNA-binding CsgD family transcriptional regulator
MLDGTTSGLALRLYEALHDGAGLLTAVQGLADQLGASSHAVHQIRYRNGRPAASVSAGLGGIAGAPMEDYARFWVRHDPWAKAGATLGTGVHDIARYVPPEELARSRIWNEWGRPNDAAFHALGVVLKRDEGFSAGVYFHRRAGQESFSGRELSVAEFMLPHLRRAFVAEEILAPARDSAGPALRAGLDALPEGVVLLDTHRRLAFANRAMQAMAAQADGLSLASQGGITAPDPKARHALWRATTAALAVLEGQMGLLPFAGSIAVPRLSGGAPWLIRAVPVTRTGPAEMPGGFQGVMLLVTDGERRVKPNGALLMRLYGLSSAQAALATALAAGRSVGEHAAQRRIAVSTAQGHLSEIRKKTGCRRLSDLTALLARLPE